MRNLSCRALLLFAGAGCLAAGQDLQDAPRPGPTPAAPGIVFDLERPARVSINVYDRSGRVVRELLHAAPYGAGTHRLAWDGCGEDGTAVAPGEYDWKLLAVPGLRASYRLSLGANYPPGDSWRDLGGPGCHATPGAVAVDETGIYVAARTTENIETCVLKLTPDGRTRVWSALHPRPWDGALSLAADAGELFMLGHVWRGDPRIKAPQARKQLLYVYEATSGRLAARFVGNTPVGAQPLGIDVQWDAAADKAEATDMDAHGGVLVVAFAGRNALRWYDPRTGERLAECPVPEPRGVAVGRDGAVFVTSGDRLVRLSRDAVAPVVLATGLAEPGRLAVDRESGELLVWLGGTRQVQRFAADGRPAATYGTAGGRGSGLYDAQAQQSFTTVGDIASDGNGGFFVTEPEAAPRRTARFDAHGKLAREWYGGQPWAPWVAVEPDNLNAVWTVSGGGDLMRLLVDDEARTWRVHSTYRLEGLGGGLVPGQNNATLWEARLNNGELYLCRIEHHGGDPVVVRVDRTHWRLLPATVCLGNLPWRRKGGRLPAMVGEQMGNHQAMQWNDRNGDGIPQPEEFTWHTENAPGHGAAGYDHGLNTLYHGGQFGVTEWLPSGAPVYGTYPKPEPMPATPPGRVNKITSRWGAYFHRDAATGDLYGAFNDRMPDWGKSEDSFLVRWNAAGEEQWTVGRLGEGPGRIWRPFRRIAGMAHGCVVATGFSYEYRTDGVSATYVWDRDGLWVGSLFDDLNLEVAPEMQYALGGEALAAQVVELPDGDCLFFACWINEVRVFRITGWQNWVRRSGRVRADAAAGPIAETATAAVTAVEVGQGLHAEYYRTPVPEPAARVLTRVDPVLDFTWGKLGPDQTPLPEIRTPYSVRWSGFLIPPESGLFGFRTDGSGVGVVEVAGVAFQVPIRDRAARPNWRVRLTAGVPYPITVRYDTRATHPSTVHGLRLQWQLPARNDWQPVPGPALRPALPEIVAARVPWSSRKPTLADGKIAGWEEAPEFLAWRSADPAADGFAGEVLTVTLTGPFIAGAWSQHAGALYALPRPVPAGEPFTLRFKARSLVGPPHLTVLRTWGGAKPWDTLEIGREWREYAVTLEPQAETTQVTFSLAPKKGRLQPYCAGTFEVAEVTVETAKTP